MSSYYGSSSSCSSCSSSSTSSVFNTGWGISIVIIIFVLCLCCYLSIATRDENNHARRLVNARQPVRTGSTAVPFATPSATRNNRATAVPEVTGVKFAPAFVTTPMVEPVVAELAVVESEVVESEVVEPEVVEPAVVEPAVVEPVVIPAIPVVATAVAAPAPPPKKYIKDPKGRLVLNPAYKAWKEADSRLRL